MDETKLIAATLAAGLLQARAIIATSGEHNTLFAEQDRQFGGPLPQAAVELYRSVLAELTTSGPSSTSP